MDDPNPHPQGECDDEGLPGPPERTFDAIAREFDRARGRPWEFVVDWLRTIDVPEGLLVDVGCGNGRHMELGRAMGHECVGVDVSAPMLAVARARLGPCAPLVQGDARALPLASGSASVVLAVAVIHHLRSAADRATAVGEVARVLRPGGRALVSVWALDDPEVAARARAVLERGGCQRGGGETAGEGDGEEWTNGTAGRGDPRDLLVAWRASPGGPVDRYYRVVGPDELAELCERADLCVMWAGRCGANHVVVVERSWQGGTT